MTSLNMSNGDSVLKQLYVAKKVQDATYESRPLFATLNKFEGFGGRNLPVPIKFGNPQGRSAVFSTAQSNRTAAKFEDFVITRVADYSVATVDGQTALATRGDSMAFLNALTAQIDGAMAALSDAHETFLFRDGAGWIGQVSASSTVSSASITLASIHDVTNFEVGMTLVASATTTGAVRTGSEVLLSINRSSGVLGCTSAAWNTVITNLAASDYLFVSGDAYGTSSAYVKVAGLERWFPATAPTSGDSFFGVDRSVDSRLMGNRHVGTSQNIEEALIDAQSVGAREGAMIDRCFLNHVQVRTLKKELGARIEYSKVPSKSAAGDYASISFRSCTIEGDRGPIEVIAANKCPSTVAWLLTSDSLTFGTLGPAVQMLMLDGSRILRQSTSDGYEVRVGFYGNLYCDAPGHNVRCSLTEPS